MCLRISQGKAVASTVQEVSNDRRCARTRSLHALNPDPPANG